MSLKKLIKMVKELNDLELTSDPIDVDEDDEEALKEEFIQAIEEIDDDGKADEIDEDIIDFYEGLIEGGDDDEKKKKKKKKEKKDPDEDGDDNGDGEFDEDELREELEDMDVDEIKEYIEDNELEIEAKVKKKNLEDVVDEIIEEAEKAAKKAAKKKKEKAGKKKKEKKEKKGKKKKEKKDKKEKLPKGLRSGTLPAVIYKEIEDGGSTMDKLAKVVAKEKGKKADQVINLTMRTIIRKVSSAVPINALLSGDEGKTLFTVAEVEDDD